MADLKITPEPSFLRSDAGGPQPKPDAITFRLRSRAVEYGDKRVFQEYSIGMFYHRKLVGMERGPRRVTVTREEALRAARARISVLRKHRLFAIRVTDKHISDGQARSCNTCAVSQALWHNQERMGFGKYEYSFRVSTYACFADAEGIVISEKYGSDKFAIDPEHLPMIPFEGRSKRLFGESMIDWTMQWDEWAESRHMPLSEWREKHGYQPEDRPCRPAPCSFVLDLDAFEEIANA